MKNGGTGECGRGRLARAGKKPTSKKQTTNKTMNKQFPSQARLATNDAASSRDNRKHLGVSTLGIRPQQTTQSPVALTTSNPAPTL
jgi:hypothetical protein